MGTSDTRHQELTELLDSASEDMPYKVGSLTAFEVKNSYWQRGLNRKFGGLEPSALDSNVRAALEEWVRCLLGDYFIPGEDAILPVTTLIVGGTPKQSVKEFVDQLRVASAVLGGARVATLLLEWAQGKPIKYWRRYVLSGVTIEHPLILNSSVCVESLITDGYAYRLQVPFGSVEEIDGAEWSGLAKLSVEFEAQFPRGLPQDADPETMQYMTVFDDVKHNSRGIERFSIVDFCDALGLASNHHISCIVEWTDLEDWEVLREGSGFGRPSTLLNSSTPITFEKLEQAYGLFRLRQSPDNRTMEREIRIPIERWMRSHRYGVPFADQLIDLRIALEGLYASGNSQDSLSLGSRIALTGAWHLGENFAQRREYQKALRDAYNLTSKAVHTGSVERTEANQANFKMTQELCRRGIIQRLHEKEKPDWASLILGLGRFDNEND